MPTDCQSKEKDQIKTRKQTNKKIQVILLVLQSPLCASGWEGQGLSVGQSAPTPLFLDFNALEKALISWVQYFKIETQTSFSMNIQKKKKKKHKIFQCLRDRMSSVGAPPRAGRLLTNERRNFFDDGQLIEMLRTWFQAKNHTWITNQLVMDIIYRGAASSVTKWPEWQQGEKNTSYAEAKTPRWDEDVKTEG